MSKALCPQCGEPLMYNDVGAWCLNYPCRYVLNRRRAITAAKIVRRLWGPIR